MDPAWHYEEKHLDECIFQWILRTIKNFKGVLNISSTQMKQKLQYFITTNNFSFEMFSFVSCLNTVYHLPCTCA